MYSNLGLKSDFASLLLEPRMCSYTPEFSLSFLPWPDLDERDLLTPSACGPKEFWRVASELL